MRQQPEMSQQLLSSSQCWTGHLSCTIILQVKVLGKRYILESSVRAPEMAQRKKAFSAYLVHLTSIPRTHMGEGEAHLTEVFLWPSHTCSNRYTHTHTHTHTHTGGERKEEESEEEGEGEWEREREKERGDYHFLKRSKQNNTKEN